MAAINQEDLIGSIVPSVYISKITLETSGATLKEDNPHIDHVREKKFQREQVDSDALVVKIDFVLKEKLTDDLIGSWFANRDIGKYLEVKILQSTDSMLTSLLSTGADAIELIDPKKNLDKNDVRFKLASKVLGTNNVRDTLEKINRISDARVISVKKDVQGNDSKLSQFKSRVDDDGNVVYDITYHTQFEIPNSNPEHLAYFAVSSFDVVQLARDFDLEFDESTLKRMNSKVISEVVIDNFDMVARSYIFYDAEGKIWAGPVHRRQNGQWFSKSQPQQGSVPLTRTSVSNTKVQDFRNVKEIERLMIDFSVIEKEVLSKNVTKRLTNDVIENTREENYFSDMYLSRDKDGDSKFFFSVDIEKAIINNSLFGRLIKTTPRLRSDLIKGSQIRSMRVLRERIKETESYSRAGNPINIKPFDKNEPLELVANSSEKQWKTFKEVNNDVGSLKEVEIVTSEELLGVRHFTGMDKTMSDVTDGVYRYVVEMEIDDATVEYIQEKIQNLLNARADLENYLTQASQPSMSKYLAEVRDPHIESPSEFAGTRGSTAGTYDPISNRFTQNFIEKMNAKYPGRQRASAPWVAAVSVYIDTLDMFTNSLSAATFRFQVVNALYSFVSPRTGNPRGIASVIKLIDNLANVLAKMIGTSITVSPRKYQKNGSQRSAIRDVGKSPKRTFKLVKSFNDVFDSEVVKGVGVDFLSRGEDETQNDNGLRVIGGDDYAKRIELETLRFFKTPSPDINLTNLGEAITENDSVDNTSFTFVSPTRFDLPKRSIVTLEGATSQELDNSFQDDGGRTTFTAVKEKKNRSVERIEEGKVEESSKYLELQASIANQTSKDSPTEPTQKRSAKGKDGFKAGSLESLKEPTKQSRQSTIDGLSGASSGLSMTLGTFQVIVNTDEEGDVALEPPDVVLVPERTTECQTPDPLVSQENNRDDSDITDPDSIIPLMQLLTLPAIKNGTSKGRKGYLRKTNVQVKSGAQNRISGLRSNIVDTLKVSNLKVTQPQQGRAGSTRIIGGFKRVVSEDTVKALPNQLKALLLQSAGSNVVKKEKFAKLKATGIDSRIRADAETRFTYEMINKVEFLEGYEKDDEGKIIVKSPIWSDFTKQKYDLMIGESVFCRMKRYENNLLDLKDNKGLETAMYDQYFIVVPKTTRKPATRKPIVLEAGALTTKIVDDVRKTLPNSDIVQSSRGDRTGKQVEDDDAGLLNIPIRIEVRETNDKGLITSKVYDIKDTSFVSSTPETSTKVNVRGKDVLVPDQFLAEIVATDCQSENVETELLQNNFIEAGSVMLNLKDAAEEEGVELVIVDSFVGISEIEEQCEQPNVSRLVRTKQVESRTNTTFNATAGTTSEATTPSSAESILERKTQNLSRTLESVKKSSKRK